MNASRSKNCDSHAVNKVWVRAHDKHSTCSESFVMFVRGHMHKAYGGIMPRSASTYTMLFGRKQEAFPVPLLQQARSKEKSACTGNLQSEGTKDQKLRNKQRPTQLKTPQQVLEAYYATLKKYPAWFKSEKNDATLCNAMSLKLTQMR